MVIFWTFVYKYLFVRLYAKMAESSAIVFASLPFYLYRGTGSPHTLCTVVLKSLSWRLPISFICVLRLSFVYNVKFRGGGVRNKGVFVAPPFSTHVTPTEILKWGGKGLQNICGNLDFLPSPPLKKNHRFPLPQEGWKNIYFSFNPPPTPPPIWICPCLCVYSKKDLFLYVKPWAWYWVS